ncbi:MAG: rRNA maturation RNase YbeY [Muribaculaceae bacterium]|jgi:rRNA maturation RNase YbeY|nr:rRNA maturation RNase YbeY [Muribaculaceae bacterium]
MTPAFQWLVSGVELPSLDYQQLEQWIARVASALSRQVHSLNYIFCSDDKILSVNREFLQHDYYTDVITFDNCMGMMLRGDIFISLDTVRSNAVLVGTDYDTELRRVIIHGVLHLCGINDKGPGERKIMERHENDALAVLASMCH